MKNRYGKRNAALDTLIERVSLLSNRERAGDFYYKVRWFKIVERGLDVVASLLLFLLLSPLLLATAAAIRLESKGSVFYSQQRVGKNGRNFKFYKFRSMFVDADQMQSSMSELNESNDGVIFKIKKDPRITTTGRFIRKFSIDELPQLFNVIRGDMSLVGPRPALPNEVAEYTLEQRKRLHVSPGITCLWQVSGRSDIPFSGQMKLDLLYIRKKGFWTNLMILIKTIPAVISGKGAY